MGFDSAISKTKDIMQLKTPTAIGLWYPVWNIFCISAPVFKITMVTL